MSERKILVTRSSMPSYEEYIEAIKPLWDNHWLTNMGQYHRELESELRCYLDVPEVSLMVNGHMALEMVIQAFDFPEGAEVITTPFTFISTTHAIVRNRLKPVFCDVKEDDGTIDETKLEMLITDKTVAILPVHVYGNICNVEAIQEIADRHNLKVIYDAAHAFGECYKGKGIGNYGDASIFSFHATKVFNTIEGGAAVFSDRELYEKLYNLKNFGIRGEESVVSVGANAKMNEFCAVMGLCNLRHIDEVIADRAGTYAEYRRRLSKIEGIRFLTPDMNVEMPEEEVPPLIECKRNYAYFPIVIEDTYGASCDELYRRLRDRNIYARKYFYPLTSDQECYKHEYVGANLKVARELSKRVLVLPFYAGMEVEVLEEICEVIGEVWT